MTLKYSCAVTQFSAILSTETTQIWGKEFPGGM